MAPTRSLRPHTEEQLPRRRLGPEHLAECPLCSGNEQQTPPETLTMTMRDTHQPWSVRVVPNLYPIVSPTADEARGGKRRTATGIHEVVVETPFHNQELPDREPAHVRLFVDAIEARLRELEARTKTQHVVAFKNKGKEAGTSLEHPHSQIVALDFVPQSVRQGVQIARRHFRSSGDCLLCSIVAEERQDGTRIVFEGNGFVAFAPYASSSAGEVLLVPLTHAPSFNATSSDDRGRLTFSLIALLRGVRDAFDDPAYNLLLHTAPKRWHDDAALHWYWQLTPRLTRTAGLELATDLNINPLAPEFAANQLRNVQVQSGEPP